MEYKVSFTYPHGRIEEIEDTFATLDEAIKFGLNLRQEVKNNRLFRARGEADVITPAKKKKPYFIVIGIDGKDKSVVYDSRKPNK